MDMVGTLTEAFQAVYPYLSDPTILMSLIISISTLASLSGKLSWRYTGLIMILGAVYAQLAQIFGPEAAAAMIASNIVSFVVGKVYQSIKQSVMPDLDTILKEK